jgi:hypothetical protein
MTRIAGQYTIGTANLSIEHLLDGRRFGLEAVIMGVSRWGAGRCGRGASAGAVARAFGGAAWPSCSGIRRPWAGQ